MRSLLVAFTVLGAGLATLAGPAHAASRPLPPAIPVAGPTFAPTFAGQDGAAYRPVQYWAHPGAHPGWRARAWEHRRAEERWRREVWWERAHRWGPPPPPRYRSW